MPKAIDQKLLLSFKMMTQIEADKVTEAGWSVFTITYGGIQFSPTQVFVYLKKCLL